MVTMVQSAVNWRNMHTHMDRTHSHTHLHQQLQPCGVKCQLSYYFSVHAGSFCVEKQCQTDKTETDRQRQVNSDHEHNYISIKQPKVKNIKKE